MSLHVNGYAEAPILRCGRAKTASWEATIYPVMNLKCT
jgi:hypothetical protein